MSKKQRIARPGGKITGKRIFLENLPNQASLAAIIGMVGIKLQADEQIRQRFHAKRLKSSDFPVQKPGDSN